MAVITNPASESATFRTARKGRRPHRSRLETSTRKPRRRRQSRSRGTPANDQYGRGLNPDSDSSQNGATEAPAHLSQATPLHLDDSEREPSSLVESLDVDAADSPVDVARTTDVRPDDRAGVRADNRPDNRADNRPGNRPDNRTDIRRDSRKSDDKSDSDKTSFLSMYFRDMSTLDVLRPEEEFVAARHIEELELTVWQQIFCYPPIVKHMVQILEQALDNSVDEFRALTEAADRVRKSSSKSTREQLQIAARTCAGKLHALDSDRDYLNAALREIDHIERGTPSEVAVGRPRFSPKSRLFAAYVRDVRAAEKAAERARNDFVRANLRLVVSIARRFNHGRMALADLIQEGNIGLMKAVQRYDYRRGFRFSTYASWWIRHAISRALADKGREVRLPVHMIDAHHKLSKAKRELTSKLGRKPTNDELSQASQIPTEKIEKMRSYLIDQSFSLDRPVNDDDGRSFLEFLRDPRFEDDSLTDTLNQHALSIAVRNALQELKPIEADILRQRFGLDTHREHTLKQIGEKYNLSRERIRQLQEQALSKVRALMARQRLAM